ALGSSRAGHHGLASAPRGHDPGAAARADGRPRAPRGSLARGSRRTRNLRRAGRAAAARAPLADALRPADEGPGGGGGEACSVLPAHRAAPSRSETVLLPGGARGGPDGGTRGPMAHARPPGALGRGPAWTG